MMRRMKIAIQGLEASYHALAARQLFGEDTELEFCRTFKDVFDMLTNKTVDSTVVAIENSLYGSINEVYDLLLKHRVYITAEAYEHIALHLLGVSGSTLSDLTDVYSQAPALAEAQVFLEHHLPQAEIHEHQDTALAAKEVAAWKDKTKAAIASEAAATQYKLTKLASNIETHHSNYTRFIALSRVQPKLQQGNKASLTFQTNDIPGALYNALGVFMKHHANLTKLESRPIIGAAWQYMYYTDFSFEGDVQQIISELASHASNVRLLGVYSQGIMNQI